MANVFSTLQEVEATIYYLDTDYYPGQVSAQNVANVQELINSCIKHLTKLQNKVGQNAVTANSARRRVKPWDGEFTVYFVSDDFLNNAMFDVVPDFQGACNVKGDIRGALENWEIDSYDNWFDSKESKDIVELLKYDAEGSTGVDMHECSEADYIKSCNTIRDAVKQRWQDENASVNSARLNSNDTDSAYTKDIFGFLLHSDMTGMNVMFCSENDDHLSRLMPEILDMVESEDSYDWDEYARENGIIVADDEGGPVALYHEVDETEHWIVETSNDTYEVDVIGRDHFRF